MSWENDLQKAMFIGEKLIWKCSIKRYDDVKYPASMAIWAADVLYFTTQRLIWDTTEKYPQDLPYENIAGIDLESPGSGGFAGAKAFASGGGVIDIASNVKPVALQFGNKESLKYAEWLLRETMAGRTLKTAEGMPDIEGTKDPHAPPPTPKKGCFIATAACSPNSYEVIFLSKFRDDVLIRSEAGRNFIKFYYATAPAIEKIIRNFKSFRVLVRIAFIKPLVAVLKLLISK